MKQTSLLQKALLLSLTLMGVRSFAALDYTVIDAPDAKSLFSTNEPGKAVIAHEHVLYLDWKVNSIGKAFPMDVSPVLTGVVSKYELPPVEKVVATDLKRPASDFASVINERNKADDPKTLTRFKAPPKDNEDPNLSPAEKLAADQKETMVAQTVLATVIDKPLVPANFDLARTTTVVTTSDPDNIHVPISDKIALNALDDHHSAGKLFTANGTSLLSVLNFAKYNCDSMRSAVVGHFATRRKELRMKNDSIYVVSKIEKDNVDDKAGVRAVLGKNPDLVLTQSVIFADHLIKAERTIFALFAEQNRTRVIMISNLATSAQYWSKYTVDTILFGFKKDSNKDAFAKTGMKVYGKGQEAIGNLKDKVAEIKEKGLLSVFKSTPAPKKDDLDEELAPATSRNQDDCDRGVAKGLIPLEQGIFSKFVDQVSR
jgi:hypothetical protein